MAISDVIAASSCAAALASGSASAGGVHVTGSSAGVTLTCTGPAGSQCTAVVQLVVVETLRAGRIVALQAARPRTRKRTVVVGSATAVLAAGQTRVLKIALNGTGKSLLTRYKTLHVGLKVTQKLGSQTKLVKSQQLTFKAPHKRR